MDLVPLVGSLVVDQVAACSQQIALVVAVERVATSVVAVEQVPAHPLVVAAVVVGQVLLVAGLHLQPAQVSIRAITLMSIELERDKVAQQD